MNIMDDQKIIDAAYETAIAAALEATELIMPFWPNPGNDRFNRRLALEVIDKEGTGNYATSADIKSEKKIIEVIKANLLLKGHSFIAEESEAIAADEEWQWIIDPIDGTPNFRNGNPDFGMCIALLKGQQPVLGLIARPALRQMVVAKYHGEALLLSYEGRELANLRELAESYSDPLEKALVGYDLGYSNRQGQLEQIAERIITKVGYAVCLASFSTGNFRLLQGMMGIYFGMSPTIMDVAPAAALIPAVGGVVSDMEGNPINWRSADRSFIGAVNPKIHQQFLDILKSPRK